MRRYKMHHRSTGMGYESHLIESADGNLVDFVEAEKRQTIIDKIARVASGEDQVAINDTEALAWIGRLIAESV